MNRRQFLGLGTATAAAMMLDPERLLWVPGAKTFFLPSTEIVTAHTMAEALRAGLVAVVPDGHGGWCEMEIALTGDGLSLVERMKREERAVVAMGGHVITRNTWHGKAL